MNTSFFERNRKGERALLVLPYSRGGGDAQRRAGEFTELAKSAGAQVLDQVGARVDAPNPRFYIGTGKADEVLEKVRALDADLVLIDHALTPVQERNLEKHLGVRVVDRAGLILDIFAQRARSHEGKLEVELAQLKHMATRLVRGWTHLERQRGGAIGLRGPGETQLETDRRLLQKRVEKLQERIEKVGVQREQQRRARLRNTLPRVALVGYTNAGKSTLFNVLTEGNAYAANQLFATLDPTVHRIEGLSCGPAVLADTVGFIRELPHDLVAAFRATLAEARDAELLLHVVDAADPERDELIGVVNAVLEEIGAGDVPQLLVYNKIDVIMHDDEDQKADVPVCDMDRADIPVSEDQKADVPVRTSGRALPRIDRAGEGLPSRVWVSAATGEGLTLLREAIGERLSGDRVHADLHLPPQAGRLRAKLIEIGAVQSERYDEHGWTLAIDAPRDVLAPLAGEARNGEGRLLQPLLSRPPA
ncbi:MAG TPA: ribosome rescue GTPase HflX [Rhodanobacteraceae bacterium]|nr:ribosome rescue GTPase HflX [Rhodanobacteraceae bacterium]